MLSPTPDSLSRGYAPSESARPQVSYPSTRERGAVHKLTFTFPKTTQPPSSQALTGHYTGKTSQGNPFSFDVSASRKSVINLTLTGNVDCTDGSSWTWTVPLTNLPIGPGLVFSHTYSGPVTIDSAVTSVTSSYSISGTLTTGGSAHGKGEIATLNWTKSNKHFNCTGNAFTWSARIS